MSSFIAGNIEKSINHQFFRHKNLTKIAHKFVKIPIHYQNPKELLFTIVSGGNALLKNPNFWKRCESALLTHFNMFSPSDLVHILNGFSKGNYFSPRIFNTVGELLTRSIGDVKIDHFYPILLSFSSSKIYIPTLISAIENRISIEYPQCSSKCLSQFLTTAKLFNHKIKRETVESLILHTAKYGGSFPPEDLSRIAYCLMDYIEECSENWNLIQDHLERVLSYLQVDFISNICKRINGMPIGLIKQSLIDAINQASLVLASTLSSSQIVTLIHSVALIYKPDSNTFDTLLNYLLRRCEDIDNFDILTVWAMAKHVNIENQYLSRIFESKVKSSIFSEKNLLIPRLKEFDSINALYFIIFDFITDTILPRCGNDDIKFLIDLTLLFKGYDYFKGVEEVKKVSQKLIAGDDKGLEYLFLTDILEDEVGFSANRFHTNVYAKAIGLFKEAKSVEKWLDCALSNELSKLDVELIPPMIYSLTVESNCMDKAAELLDYVVLQENLSTLSYSGKHLILKVIFKLKTHSQAVNDIFKTIESSPSLETYRIALSCLQTALKLNLPMGQLIDWIIKNSSVGKSLLPMALDLLVKCNVHNSKDKYDLTPVSNALSVQLDVIKDPEELANLERLADALGLRPTVLDEDNFNEE